MNILLFFFIYSFLGWLCECIYCSVPAHKFINRGFLAGPYCPIYGFGALAVIHMLDPFGYNAILLFLMGTIVTSVLEYITSWGMEVLFHTKWWDYSAHPCNLNGRICLKNSLLFGCMVLVVYYFIHPAIEHLVSMVPPHWRMAICVVAVLGFSYDFITTAHALARKNKDFREIENSIRELRQEFTNANIFPLQESLSEAVARVLDSTNADEVLLERIDKLRQRFSSFYERRKHTHARLKKAFPTRVEALSRIRAEHLFHTINERRRKSEDSSQDEQS